MRLFQRWPWAGRENRSQGLALLEAPFHDSPVIHEIGRALARRQRVALIYVDLDRFSDLEAAPAFEQAQAALRRAEKALQAAAKMVQQPAAVLAMQNLWGDDFAIYIAVPGSEPDAWVEEQARAFLTELRHLVQASSPQVEPGPFRSALTLITGEPGRAASLAYQAARRAMLLAKEGIGPDAMAAQSEFRLLLDEERITAVYQPIVTLASGQILGWEALSRGPVDSRFHRPDALFEMAAQVGLTWPLERTCRRRAISGMGSLDSGQKLFLNVNANSINDPQFIQGETLRLLAERRLRPENVVFEITERTSIRDFETFRRALQHYRSEGFLIAVDDVGAGYSSLQAIAELRPDFIKLDMSLVRDGSHSVLKQGIVEAFVAFAGKIGCSLIAEGIETRDDLRTVVRLGVAYGQGYYLARPGAPAPLVSETARHSMLTLNRLPSFRPSLQLPVEQLLTSIPTVTLETPVREVAELLKSDESPEAVAVLTGTQVEGIVMRDRLFRELGVPFGVALHYDRPIAGLMNRAPAVFEVGTPIEQVARQVSARDARHRYDIVVVTEGGTYRGVLSVQNLLHSLTEAQLTVARLANPLTGLPGNHAIHAELERRLRENEPCTVIYADLDSFKAFNDAYGFHKGDKVLLLTGRLLARMVAKYGGTGTFTGHVGGDDFVAVVQQAHAERVCVKLIAAFNRLAPSMKAVPAAAAGSAPPFSISLAAVDLTPGDFSHPEEIAQAAATLKREAKAQLGSSLRRSGTPSLATVRDAAAENRLAVGLTGRRRA